MCVKLKFPSFMSCSAWKQWCVCVALSLYYSTLVCEYQIFFLNLIDLIKEVLDVVLFSRSNGYTAISYNE